MPDKNWKWISEKIFRGPEGCPSYQIALDADTGMWWALALNGKEISWLKKEWAEEQQKICIEEERTTPRGFRLQRTNPITLPRINNTVRTTAGFWSDWEEMSKQWETLKGKVSAVVEIYAGEATKDLLPRIRKRSIEAAVLGDESQFTYYIRRVAYWEIRAKVNTKLRRWEFESKWFEMFYDKKYL